MELFLLSDLTLFFLFLSFSLLSILLFYTLRFCNPSHPNLPPGKMGFPFIGESLEFLSTGQNGHPEKFIHERMAKYSSQVFKTSILGESFAVFCGAAGNRFLFSNEAKLVISWWPSSVNKIFPSSQQTSTIEASKKMRKLLPGFFKPEALQKYIGIMDAIAENHFKADWETRKELTVFPLAKKYTFWLACRLFLSIEDPEKITSLAAPFNALASGIISIPINLPGTPFNNAIKASNKIRKELRRIIKQRKVDIAEKGAFPTQDILSYMLVTEDENGDFVSEMEIADKILGLLVGGHDTASAAVTFVVKYLAELPNIYSEVHKEQMEIVRSKKEGESLNWEDIQKMKYSWNVACEVLRLAPPLQGAFREALADFSFAGFSIPKGWKLYWSTNSTHRNPRYFPEPEKFDPSRFEGNGPEPYTFVPFGGGPRMCPGKEYGRLEILVFIHHLVKRFKWKKLIPNEKIVVNPMPMPAQDLPIRLFPHNP